MSEPLVAALSVDVLSALALGLAPPPSRFLRLGLLLGALAAASTGSGVAAATAAVVL